MFARFDARSAPLRLLPLFALLACSPARFPDGDDVKAAQREWCGALAKIHGADASWEHHGRCAGTYPTASAAYVRGVTTCVLERVEAAGDETVDLSQTAIDCTDRVLVELDAPRTGEIIDARCQRMERCEKVPRDDCQRGVAELQSSQRALFTSAYNQGALHDVAGCLSSASCSDDEEAARSSCYEPAAARLLWLPD